MLYFAVAFFFALLLANGSLETLLNNLTTNLAGEKGTKQEMKSCAKKCAQGKHRIQTKKKRNPIDAHRETDKKMGDNKPIIVTTKT